MIEEDQTGIGSPIHHSIKKEEDKDKDRTGQDKEKAINLLNT